jgi:hypothetical protein
MLQSATINIWDDNMDLKELIGWIQDIPMLLLCLVSIPAIMILLFLKPDLLDVEDHYDGWY